MIPRAPTLLDKTFSNRNFRAQLLTVELVILVVVSLFVFSIFFVYYWRAVRKTENTIQTTTSYFLLKDIGKTLSYLFTSQKAGAFTVYISPTQSLATDQFSIYVLSKEALEKGGAYYNQSPKQILASSDSASFQVDYINFTSLDLLDNWSDFVKQGNILVIYVPDLFAAQNLYWLLLLNVSPRIRLMFNTTEIDLNSAQIEISPIYYHINVYFRPFKIFNGSAFYKLNLSFPWIGLKILEYYYSPSGKLYLLGFVLPYGKGSIIVTSDPELYEWLQQHPTETKILAEHMKLDAESGTFRSEYRQIANPYFYSYTYYIYACRNLLVITKGFSQIEVYKLENVSSQGINATLYYRDYTAGLASVPVPGCAGYIVKTTAPAIIFGYSNGGFTSVLTQKAIIPVADELIICGSNTTLQLHFINYNVWVPHTFPETYPQCIYIDLKNVSGTGYDYSDSLVEITSSLRPVFVYFSFGSWDPDTVVLPGYNTGSSVIYYVPRIAIEHNGNLYYYWLVMTTVLDNNTHYIDILDGNYIPSQGFEIAFHNTTAIRFYNILFYPPQSNVVRIVASPGTKAVLMPIIYNVSTLNINTNSEVIASHGAIYFPDSFIFMPLLTDNPSGRYQLAIYTSAPNILIRFYAFKSDYSRLPLLNINDLSVSNLRNYLRDYGGTPKIFIANITEPDYYCDFETGNNLFFNINATFLYLSMPQCRCYNETLHSFTQCTPSDSVTFKAGDVYYVTSILKSGNM
jgi:hypothetical protein